ncbi:hypothetical protein GX917_00920 [Candidatus Falkowbacteria bacterium]|jgi:hypothetical protein|nr:hypothetical protein [Candidatus Falkowbacteria bacterium]
MFQSKIKLKFFPVLVILLISLLSFYPFKLVIAAPNLSGRILLQVQDKGQAWYVNPVDGKRYYLGRPDDAFAVMRAFGLGISNADFNSFSSKAPARLAGRILLKVQDKGQAYYLDPLKLELHYLGRPTDAFAVMRTLGLGITNRDLFQIPMGELQLSREPSSENVSYSGTEGFLRNFTFRYKNNNYELSHFFPTQLYKDYKNSSKTYTYASISGKTQSDIQNEFYALFLQSRKGDTTIASLVAKLRELATLNKWTDEELLEATVALVQYIPYDDVKVLENPQLNNNPYFPYETLYLNKGVCSDKTFLAVALLRQLGYGAAILDFPEKNHSALGVACPTEYSLHGSGYCYVETTNYFPFGVIPQNINNGLVQSPDGFSDMFNVQSLGKVEIYQKTSGKIYQGMPIIYSQVADLRATKNELDIFNLEIQEINTILKNKEAEIASMRERVKEYYDSGQTAEYNRMVPIFNSLVKTYNEEVSVYKGKVSEYNSQASVFNLAVKSFYQK